MSDRATVFFIILALNAIFYFIGLMSIPPADRATRAWRKQLIFYAVIGLNIVLYYRP